ncbi:Ohr family peroxiredoxin [Mycoplasmoides gallisepticum]|uniref:Organic hydroperoxide resistance protein n=5 Tax=Mycoplasmoides gallisepticum TaxID=2096 RepID=Q7NBI1_MYCGA|nr:Ohr family peroxiredoxin [Mycoplasmoides gallisepticum]AAP56637.2 organic hydroperoxide resistance protein [Mycoplasmoides gallisepticum str. R(low)]ADC30486.1 organic hydroperoxide resistance protein [Mycoplasmoides gallisepticum str. R(high)]ADC31477.1 organic hydroperoxide resistance protein [Mycoplasmoides gallisepticum str. F]AFP75889.1 organic hydroperoxide resistance protein [Mycoplasmoides gallisepticum VA94_7994-1-7P]AFP76656.1 organic hydroperoxide resistance protein [Mycoplasmoid
MFKKVYETAAVAKVGREGLVKTTDGQLSLNLGFPKAMGGSHSDRLNPEQLFAAGYASCFSQAVFAVSKKLGHDLKEAPIEVTVQLHVQEEPMAFELRVGISLTVDLPEAKAKELMKLSHETCPYSKLAKPSQIIWLKVNGMDVPY